ncbi:aldose 1-epimerase [Paenibacillus antri]|uniref:Aldose 1-epimerase n=1 Tax=Paenibacillus antri TaxID=2582848 RepID=A0A5R9FZR2_9BACL|nr:aldose 1-epimerase [Paenibacillus antri]TLS49001.1 aldose 1-epimerase [Paenibacillus antri]
MSRYRYEWLERDGESICRLIDAQEEAEAHLLPGFGMNVVRYVSQGRDVLLQPPSFAALRETPFRYGIPALAPPGRTSGGAFEHRGVRYALPVKSGKHNMHGEIGIAPWRIGRQGADAEQGAFLQAEYAYRDDPVRFAAYPADLRFAVTYRLKEGELSLEGSVRNEGSRHAPLALGYHPYFACDRGRTTLRIPAYAQWTMNEDGGAGAPPKASSLADSLREGLELSRIEGNLHYLQCREFAMDPRGTDAYECRLEDRGLDRTIRYETDGLFAVTVLFLPPWGESVSLEPHTCIPDAYNLPLDALDTGALELAPGEERRFGWRIAVDNGASA